MKMFTTCCLKISHDAPHTLILIVISFDETTSVVAEHRYVTQLPNNTAFSLVTPCSWLPIFRRKFSCSYSETILTPRRHSTEDNTHLRYRQNHKSHVETCSVTRIAFTASSMSFHVLINLCWYCLSLLILDMSSILNGDDTQTTLPCVE
jgi:hypothetical protein